MPFWNSPWAIPAAALTSPEPPLAELDRELQAAHAREAAIDLQSWGVDETAIVDGIMAGHPDLVWAAAEVLYDRPEKAAGLDPRAESGIQARLEQYAARSEREVLIASPNSSGRGRDAADAARACGARVAAVQLPRSAGARGG
jgi:hypothetical protein